MGFHPHDYDGCPPPEEYEMDEDSIVMAQADLMFCETKGDLRELIEEVDGLSQPSPGAAYKRDCAKAILEELS